jgi:TetR/AcrR family transcriptional regulator
MGKAVDHREVIQERKRQEREQRVADILDAAKKLFFLKGYLKMTMDDIALEVRVSKPTIYQFFKSKDELFFSLMIPSSEKTEKELGGIERNLLEGRYTSGSTLLHEIFQALYNVYQADPEAFRILQLFQQSGMVWALNEDVRRDLVAKARITFSLGRSILQAAMEQGLIHRQDIYPLNDVVWALFVGIVQLEDTKSKEKGDNLFLKKTMEMAEHLLIEAMATDGFGAARPPLEK